jgi:Ca2+-binding RTX toxin-like protein
MRLRRGACVLILCIAALATAQSGRAALSWQSEASCVPCFDVAVIVQGNGHVTGVPVEAADASERLECPAVNGFMCEHFFIWQGVWGQPGTGTVLLTPTAGDGSQFRGWEPGKEGELGCPEVLDGGVCRLTTTSNGAPGWCLKAVFDGDGTTGTCPPLDCRFPPLCGGPPCPPFCPPPPGVPDPPPPPAHPSWGAACTIVGTKGRDILRGTAKDDVLCGKGGNDVLYGLRGNDVLRGGAGADHLLGGIGNDKLDGGLGRDVLDGGTGADLARTTPGDKLISANRLR